MLKKTSVNTTVRCPGESESSSVPLERMLSFGEPGAVYSGPLQALAGVTRGREPSRGKDRGQTGSPEGRQKSLTIF